jgi:hypothetical protein
LPNTLPTPRSETTGDELGITRYFRNPTSE